MRYCLQHILLVKAVLMYQSHRPLAPRNLRKARHKTLQSLPVLRPRHHTPLQLYQSRLSLIRRNYHLNLLVIASLHYLQTTRLRFRATASVPHPATRLIRRNGRHAMNKVVLAHTQRVEMIVVCKINVRGLHQRILKLTAIRSSARSRL